MAPAAGGAGAGRRGQWSLHCSEKHSVAAPAVAGWEARAGYLRRGSYLEGGGGGWRELMLCVLDGMVGGEGGSGGMGTPSRWLPCDTGHWTETESPRRKWSRCRNEKDTEGSYDGGSLTEGQCVWQ